MEIGADDECDRATARKIQASHQDESAPPSGETAAMLFWALLASGQITMRKVDGWQTLPEKLSRQCIDLAA